MQSLARVDQAAAQPFAAAQPGGAAQAGRPLSALELLISGGDDRIVLDGPTGLNRYGCQPFPDPGALAFGSSTASVISVDAFAEVERFASRLGAAQASGADIQDLYAAEADRVRRELAALLGLDALARLKTVIAPSGTDLHHLVAQAAGVGVAAPPLVIASEPSETGSGVGAALGGMASPGVALRAHLAAARAFAAPSPCQVLHAPSRAADGSVRPIEQVDEDVAAAARAAATLGRRVVLILMDASKTGLIAPSVGCALELKRRFPEQVEVLVDACQLRLAPETLRAYLEADFLVAITGSKFMTGPTFSAALLAPEGAARRLAAGWPSDAPPAKPNFGPIARWRAALEEMRPFLTLDGAAVHSFFAAFAEAVTGRLDQQPQFERVSQRALDRAALGAPAGWDQAQTIHPFLLRGANGLLCGHDVLGLYRLAAMDLGGWARAVGETEAGQAAAALRLQLGQPVACGQRDGRPLSALRLCASARLAVTALGPDGLGAPAVIDQALAALDKTAWLCRRMTSGA